MSLLRANGVELAYDSFGDADAEPVLLIAGLGTQMIRWTDAYCTNFAGRGFRVIRFDNRDSGLSTVFSEVPPPDVRALMAGHKPEIVYTKREIQKQDVMSGIRIPPFPPLARFLSSRLTHPCTLSRAARPLVPVVPLVPLAPQRRVQGDAP